MGKWDRILLFAILICLQFELHEANYAGYFCDLPNCGFRHTVCRLEPCAPKPECGEHFKMYTLDTDLRSLVARIHNRGRNKLAFGNVTDGENGESSNMRILSYDKELEFVAQCWANACTPDTTKEACRITKNFATVGQNFCIRKIRKNTVVNSTTHITECINSWLDLSKFTDANVLSSFEPNGRTIESFTQLAWATTRRVGCGVVRFGSGKTIFSYIVCNYGPAGNVLHQSVYLRGRRCSNCPVDTQCSVFGVSQALCGRERYVPDDSYKPPFNISSSRNLGQRPNYYVGSKFIISLLIFVKQHI